TSRRLEEDDRIAVFPTRRAQEERREPRSWRAAALAAGLTGLMAAGGWFQSSREVRRLNDELAQAERPAPSAPSTPPAPDAGERIALNTWNEVIGSDVLRSSDEVVLPSDTYASPLLEAGKGDTPPEREIEILDEEGKPVLSGSGLLRNPDGYYTFTIFPHTLKPGRYTLQLYSTEGGKRTPRETYRIRVQ
ncbi:MAG TPA: hypothetical protein VL025_10990, partial [Thermoanaerobaculia bacterium]|nr:hypothetical protein [Thermoanaerobaculia bacterium]